jgi:hypothetical protein
LKHSGDGMSATEDLATMKMSIGSSSSRVPAPSALRHFDIHHFVEMEEKNINPVVEKKLV